MGLYGISSARVRAGRRWDSVVEKIRKRRSSYEYMYILFLFHTFLLSSFWTKPWSQVSSLLPPGSCFQFLSRIGFSNPTARQFFHRVLLTHAPALSACQFVHKKKSLRIYTRMHSAGLELTKLTYNRLEDKLTRHRGDRMAWHGDAGG